MIGSRYASIAPFVTKKKIKRRNSHMGMDMGTDMGRDSKAVGCTEEDSKGQASAQDKCMARALGTVLAPAEDRELAQAQDTE